MIMHSKATSPQWSTSADIASCNCCIVNGMIRLGVKSIMVARVETTLNFSTTSLHEYETLISNSCNRLYHLPLTPIHSLLTLVKLLIFNDNNR